MLAERPFDFAQLNAETAKFDLVVRHAPRNSRRAICAPPHAVTASIHTRTRLVTKRVWSKRFCGKGRLFQYPRARPAPPMYNSPGMPSGNGCSANPERRLACWRQERRCWRISGGSSSGSAYPDGGLGRTVEVPEIPARRPIRINLGAAASPAIISVFSAGRGFAGAVDRMLGGSTVAEIRSRSSRSLSNGPTRGRADEVPMWHRAGAREQSRKWKRRNWGRKLEHSVRRAYTRILAPL